MTLVITILFWGGFAAFILIAAIHAFFSNEDQS